LALLEKVSHTLLCRGKFNNW